MKVGLELVVMNIVLKNFLAFQEFSMNMSYPKRIVKTYLEGEHLKDFPSFRYKKLIILLGANASGKTSLGQMLNRILNFIMFRNAGLLLGAVRDKNQEAALELDFVISTGAKSELYRLGVKITPYSEVSSPELSSYVKKERLRKNDTYERASMRLGQVDEEYTANYVSELQKIPSALGFMFSYPSDVRPTPIRREDSESYRVVLEKVLKVLDPSIVGVEQVKEAANSYSIKFLGGSSVLVQGGETIDSTLLSSGTKAGIAIADILTAIREHEYGFYYCDERFTYIQSDVERALLGEMTKFLGDNEQLFFTTHNSDMLDLPYPKHSYVFLRKRVSGEEIKITAVSADKFLKRNTDVLRRAVENDLFLAAPCIDGLLSL